MSCYNLPPTSACLTRRGALLRAAAVAALLPMHRWSLAEAPGTAADGMAAAELKRAERQGELCSAANATGTGLRGEYFAQRIGQGAPLLVRVDSVVEFDRTLEWPADHAARRPVSARWNGWVKPPIGGRYRFHADQPGARLVVARQVLVGEGAPAGTPTVELAAGRFHPISLEMPRLDAIAGRLRLEWTAPHGARYLVPRALLFGPNESALATKS